LETLLLNQNDKQMIQSSERGAALVFVAIVVVGLFIMIGLAIDSMTMLSSYRGSQFSSNMITLAALEAYYKSDSDVVSEKIHAAETRARAILAQQATFNQAVPELNGANSTGLKLDPGQWIQPKVNNVPTGNPFFQKYTGGASETINAFRLTGNMTENVRIFLLDKILDSVATTAIPAESIATVAPRRAMFLIDLSSTMVVQTYSDRTPADQAATPENGRGSAYGFILASDNVGLVGENFSPEDQWAVINAAPTRATAPNSHQLNPKIHFKDDYKLKALFNDTDYSRNSNYVADIQKLHPNPASDARFQVGNARVYARVDGYRRSPTHLGPQPLRNLITGVRTVVSEFKSRKVYGDKVGLIFFDEGTDWRRVILPTDNFDYVLKFLSVGADDNPNTGAFDPDVLAADDNPAAINGAGLDPAAYSGQELAARMGIFPQPAANTNLILPLSYAQEFLTADAQLSSGLATTDFVVVASDGLANCKPASPGYSCNDVYDYYDAAMNVLKNSVTSSYVSSNTPIHFLMTGDMSGPHTLDMPRSSTDSTCMTDSEARTLGRQYVAAIDPTITAPGWFYGHLKPGRYPIKSADRPFYDVNVDWYDIVKQTRGLWIPIRTKPLPNGVSCVPAGSTRTCSAGIKRLDYDPFCSGTSGYTNRTTEEQTIGAAEKILGQNPYIIVRTRSDSMTQ
jgi:hypothetical protein